MWLDSVQIRKRLLLGTLNRILSERIHALLSREKGARNWSCTWTMLLLPRYSTVFRSLGRRGYVQQLLLLLPAVRGSMSSCNVYDAQEGSPWMEFLWEGPVYTERP